MRYVHGDASLTTAAPEAAGDENKTETSRFRGSILVATRTGGMGKTIITQIIELKAQLAGYELRPVSLDAANMTSTSKLKKIIPETLDVCFAPSMAEMAANPAAAFQHFDELAALLAQGGCVFDFGANLAPQFFGWVAICDLKNTLGDMPAVTLVVPTTAQPQAIGDAVEVIQLAKTHAQYLPVRKIIVVLNENEGEFSSGIAGYQDLEALLRDGSSIPMYSFVLPKLHSEIWAAVQAYAMPFRRIIAMPPKQLGEALGGMHFMKCARGERFFEIWIEKAMHDLDKIGLGA